MDKHLTHLNNKKSCYSINGDSKEVLLSNSKKIKFSIDDGNYRTNQSHLSKYIDLPIAKNQGISEEYILFRSVFNYEG